ncbi:DNA-directed RNA polymerase subunit beta' [Candidatus Hodgkinia cicadicola]|uniref:DNA-directed RNA polymerase subunit n=1 Tax=Candidatus Hodgkinia cicadicola TaxID=573658 RepID=A0ABX4MFX4_9HYPH|nr:DNA-directed RNA polymerase subunit beta' [Candidatus Hodgkinia cicadicola]PIM95571.1 DNA-directed RNA polymerase subunit beta' [Candidatus Hodgkinia cicadicola]
MLENLKNVLTIKFKLVSPETIMACSWGEVYNSVSFNIKTRKPNLNGLFCPKIFGSINTNECLCKEPTINKSLKCEICDVDLGLDKHDVRSRFGHICLNVPVVHTLFYKSDPNIIAILLNKTEDFIKNLVNCNLHVVVESCIEEVKVGQIITSDEYRKYWKAGVKALTGGIAMSDLLSKVNLKELKHLLLEHYNRSANEEILEKFDERLEIINGVINGSVSLDLLIIRLLSVLPAGLRPMFVLEGDKIINSDLNELYRQVIVENNVVSLVMEHIKEDSFIDFDDYIKCLISLQSAVDVLIDNSSSSNKPAGYNIGALKSLTEILKGKQGRFRHNILGKRVDYSGRSVIVPGPDLLLNECGIPRVMALELFKPFICAKLMLKEGITTEFLAKIKMRNDQKLANKMLDEVIKHCPVLLNRAPTLHKLNIRAFWVKLTTERAIRLHPLLCSGFNADFDGDQMAVHVPLSLQARMETMALLIAWKHVLHPAHGDPCILPSQDMILGLYYMSLTSDVEKHVCLYSYLEVHKVLENGIVGLHDKVKFIIMGDVSITIMSTPGRLLISEIVPTKCRFLYEWSFPNLNKQMVSELVDLVQKTCGNLSMIKFCEHLMTLGFKYSTKSGISISIIDLIKPMGKKILLKNMRTMVTKLWPNLFLRNKVHQNGSIDDQGTFWSVWQKLLVDIYNSINLEFQHKRHQWSGIRIMLDSGARGTWSQVEQLVGAKGNTIGLNNKLCKIPILRSYIEGLSLIQFFNCSFSSRRGLADAVLKTADSGYLARKLVEVSRECLIGEFDCNTTSGLRIDLDINLNIDLDFIRNRLIGRFLLKPIFSNGILIAKNNELITDNNIRNILNNCGKSLLIRSPLTCHSRSGCCKFCYGIELGSGKIVKYGDSVGVLAAQSISEPGTQLTLRTFHGQFDHKKDSDVENIHDCLMSPFSGTIIIKNLSCIYSESLGTIVVNTKCELIIQQNNIKVFSQTLTRGTNLLVSNNTNVGVGIILWYKNTTNNEYVSLTKGITVFKDLIYNVNIFKKIDKETKSISTSFKSVNCCKNLLPLICLKVNKNLLLNCFNLNQKEINLLIWPKKVISVFDSLLEVPKKRLWSVAPTKGGALTRLSKLFENNVGEDGCAVLAKVNGNLRYGNIDLDDGSYVLDSSLKTQKPIVYHLQKNDVMIDNNRMLKQGDYIVTEEPNLEEYAEVHGFNHFYNYFIDVVQEIYKNQGVNVNSKHIEIILKQMVNIVTVLKPGDLPFKFMKSMKWHEISRTNSIALMLGMKPVAFVRRIIGINEICSNWTSILSVISFQGSINPLIKAIMVGDSYDVTGIKDSLILGKLPPFGTGFLCRFNKSI